MVAEPSCSAAATPAPATPGSHMARDERSLRQQLAEDNDVILMTSEGEDVDVGAGVSMFLNQDQPGFFPKRIPAELKQVNHTTSHLSTSCSSSHIAAAAVTAFTIA